MLASGGPVARIIQHLAVSEGTYYRCRNQFGGMNAEEVKRLRHFGTGTILIRGLEPQGEKSWGRSGHAFARAPVLEWHSRTAAAHRDSRAGSHASPKFTVDSSRHATALHHCATACRGA
jgi:hypothetical protein